VSVSKKDAIQQLSEQSQTATQQAAATIERAKETIAERLLALRRKVGLEPRRITHSELKAVGR
jgi:hypothetical protein